MGLVNRAEQWRWGSAWRRNCGKAEFQEFLAPWPIKRPRNWLDYVNTP
jgi:putative transposase